MNVSRHDDREPVACPRQEQQLHGLRQPPPGFSKPPLVPKAKKVHSSPKHVKDKYKNALTRLAELEKENENLRGENAGLKKQYRDVYHENDKLRGTVRHLEQICIQANRNIHGLVHHTIPSLAPDRFPDFAKLNCEFVENEENIGYFKNKGSLGKGCYGEVSLGIHPDTKKSYAIKAIKKNRIYSYSCLQQTQEEIDVLRKLRHPNVIGLVECVNTPDKLYMVTEFGGYNLRQWCKGTFAEKKMRPGMLREIFYGVFKGVDYVHEEGVCHLDLKPDNVLIKRKIGATQGVSFRDVRLCDFGFATNADEPVTSKCGTGGYFAPEMVTVREAIDGRAADMWSLACILMEMTTGAPGWTARYKGGLAADPKVFGPAITKAVNEIHETKALGGYDQVGDVLKLMLQMDPKDRVPAKDLWKHPWLEPLVLADRGEENRSREPETALEAAGRIFSTSPLRIY